MFAILQVVAAAWFGRGVIRRLGLPLTLLEERALAGAVALVLAPWVLFLAAWAVGFALGLPLATTALLVGGHLLGRDRAPPPRPDMPATSLLSWIALVVVFALAFHGHMLHVEGGGLFTGGSTYGDLALHATLANHFASTEIGFASPLVANQALTYPILGDFVVACLMRGGWSISTAFAVSGFISVAVSFALIQAVVLRMFGSRRAATIAVWLIVLSGSGAGLYYAIRDFASHGLPTSFASLPSYAHDRSRGLVWANFTSDFLLPQRAFLAALPGAWAAVWATRQAFEGRERRALVLATMTIGALPFFHVHAFLIAFGLLGWCTLWRTARDGRAARDWWIALAAALVLAAPQLAWQFGESWGTSFGRWQLGWLAPKGGVAWFWVKNLGAVLFLAPLAFRVAWRQGRDGFAGALVGAATVVFIAANLYVFQPHDWDNMKFFLYAFMFVAVVLAGALATWRSRFPIAALAIFAMTASGALTLVRELDKHDQIASTRDLELARELRRVLPADARVLTSDQHNHVVPMLTGRNIVMGYRGWLWTYGIDYHRLERDVATMFAGKSSADPLLRKYGVTHIYVGPGEKKTLHADLERLRARYRRVLDRNGIEVFALDRDKASIVGSQP
jgi:hypothetical protein